MTRILVIDDNKDNLVSVKALLKQLEPAYKVLTAEGGRAGIKLARSGQPDTILLDIQMPRMDGYEVCRRLRADKKTEHIPIIFLTAVKTSSKDRIKGLELGCDAYLAKPINEGELLAVLHAMLRIKKAEGKRLQRYKDIVSSSTDMLALIDREFTYLAVNQSYLIAFQKTLGQVVGKKVPEIVGGKYFETNIKPHAKRCLAGEIVNFHSWFDFPGFEKRYLDITYSPHYGENNKIDGFVANGRNITKLKLAEEKFKSIFKFAPDAYYLNDMKGNLIDGNKFAEKLTGYNREELIGKNFLKLNLLPNHQIPKVTAILAKNALGKTTGPDEIMLNRKDGSKVDVEISAHPVKIGGKRLVLGIARDITRRKKAEKALRKSENQYRNVVENLYEVLFETDNEGHWLYLNPAWTKITGYSVKESLGQVFLDYVYHEDRELNVELFRPLMEGKKEYCKHEIRYLTKDKRIKWIEVFGRLSFDSKNEISGTIGTLSDITERKKGEEELKKAKEYAQNLIDTSMDMIVSVDLKRKIQEFNPAAEKAFGYTKEEILGKHVNILYANENAGRKVHKTTVAKGSHVTEILNKRKNGETFPCLLEASVLNDSKGNSMGVMGVSRDITKEKAAQEAIKESEESFRVLTNTATDAILGLNENGAISVWNQAAEKLFGYTKKEAIGKDLHALVVPKKYHKKAYSGLKKFFNTGKGDAVGKTLELTGLKKNGIEFPLELSMSGVKRHGKWHATGIIRNISDRELARKKLEVALEQAREGENAKTLFLTNMSHEVRTPLNSILGFTELLKMSTKDKIDAEEQEFFDTITESGYRLMHTVHEILDMSQIEAETLPVSLKKYDLAELVEKAVKPFIHKADLKNLELNINTASGAFILADENYVVKSVVNLLENAIKYTEKGRIDIEIKEKANTIKLTIKDTGIGIGKEYLKDIFQVFTQESTGYTKKYQGVGLGLALVKNYLELCDATIAVKSKKNVGSTFTITFKKMKWKERRKQKRIEKPKAETTKIELDVSIDKPQVLLVEDDQNSQRLLSFFLRDYYDLEFAVSVMAAKEKLESKKVEMVLLDLSLLGDEDGLDLARYMRKSKKWQKIPIIAITAHAFTEDKDKCLEAGCNDYLAKPIVREKLIDKIKQQLDLA